MNYQNIKYEGANAAIALFGRGRKEAHAYITVSDTDADTASQIMAICKAAERLASDTGLSPVFKRYLLSDPANQVHLLPMEDDCARSVIRQSPLDGSKGALLIILEENGDYSSKGDGLWINGKGRIWVGDNPAVAPADSRTMTIEHLDRLGKALAAHGGTLKDNCLRTWLFVRDIDNNYRGVVEGRNEVFDREGLTRDTHFIASTGIEGQCAEPGRLVAFNAFADTRITPTQVTFLHGRTHLNPTYEYGVAFERAAAVDYSDRRHVYISGTASIDCKGRIVAPGDIKAQAQRMLENIEVLLKEGECGWEDVAHMTVYLRDIADHQLVRNLMAERFPLIPKVIVLAPVCRPGWLIETECMAVKKACNPQYAAF